MEYHVIPHCLPGYPEAKTIRIVYDIPAGLQVTTLISSTLTQSTHPLALLLKSILFHLRCYNTAGSDMRRLQRVFDNVFRVAQGIEVSLSRVTASS
jgi:hypothetical protein